MLNSLFPEYRMELLVQYKPLHSEEMMMIYMMIFIVFWLISVNYDIICFIVKSTALTSREIDDAFFDFYNTITFQRTIHSRKYMRILGGKSMARYRAFPFNDKPCQLRLVHLHP